MVKHTLVAGALAVAMLASLVAPAQAGEPSAQDETVKRLVQEELKAWMEKEKAASTKDKAFTARWNNGLLLETPDKSYSMRIGGRIHLDTNFVDPEEGLEGPAPGINEEWDDTTWFRRLRLYVRGDLTPYVDYNVQLEFGNPGTPGLRDAFITIKNLKKCFGCWMPSIRVGQQYEPIGLETVSSDNHTLFIERAGMLALHPERSIGLALLDSFWNERASCTVGIYSNDNDDEENGFGTWDEEEGDGGTAISGRFAFIPWAKDTCHFLHVGATASSRHTDEVRYRSRPGTGRGPRLVDTGTITDPDSVLLLNGELGAIWGPFHVWSELTHLAVQDDVRDDPAFTAWHVSAGWFLTGESKAYDFKNMLWGNTKPCCNFLDKECCCWGAFELVARVDRLDLTDGTVRGGEMTMISGGLNWYLNPHARMMFNVTHATADERTGPGAGVVVDGQDVTTFLMRMDVHF
ncbi:MAG: OprO/OprP family phosphate-selective porin [Planctomycetia bacterium]